MKIVVTGALGHIGSSLIRRLGEFFQHPTIIMIDDVSTQRYGSLFDLPDTATYHFIEGKVQTTDWDCVLKGVHVVIHLAATTDASGTAHTPDLVYTNNYSATNILAQACLKHGVRLFFPSTTSVYGSQASVVDETCVDLLPQSPYAACKIKEESLLNEMACKGLPVAIARLGTIYGPSKGMRFHTAVNKFCWQAIMQQPLTVWETALHQKRPYLSLYDATAAIAWLIKNDLFIGQTYNVVTANHTVKDIIDTISIYVKDVKVEYVQHAIMNQLSYEVSSEKLQQTGFTYTGTIQDGIRSTVALLKNAQTRE